MTIAEFYNGNDPLKNKNDKQDKSPRVYEDSSMN